MSLIIGIWLQYLIPFSFNSIIIGLSLSIIALIASHFWQNKQFHSKPIFTLFLVFTSIFIGAFITHQSDERTNPNHYTHFIKKDAAVLLKLNISKVLKPTAYYKSYIAEINSLNNQKVNGKILLKTPQSKPDLLPGMTIHVLTDFEQLKSIPSPKNPFSFDYSKFMAYQNIFHQINLNHTAFSPDKTLTNQWENFIFQLRTYLKQNIDLNIHDKDVRALLNALLLGERQDLSPEVYQNFQSAGTVHILAISGLHIGILLIFLNFLFKPVKNISKPVFLILTILILWLYALLTGFSPSVLRAVIMFSFLQIGLQLK
ncbi:MAG TPA: ComEC family competence protein, partial [Flavobacteriales bacterium]|nr:ComEC family competence protein [Flavobacteriales bacterium]